jgi:hypothetical protein
MLTSVVSAIAEIKKSRYFLTMHQEPRTRTLVDILLCDRLSALRDEAANRQLHVATEVPLQAKVLDDFGGGYISGRADWTLGYGNEKGDVGSILVGIEAKKQGYTQAGVSQLLAYLASVQDARKASHKINSDVFGMVTDFSTFQFIVLRSNRTAYYSPFFIWATQRREVVTYLDHILSCAIDSSPHTTPVKDRNTTIKKFGKRLSDSFRFGSPGSPSAHEDEGEESELDESAWNVIVRDGVSILVPITKTQATIKDGVALENVVR